MTLLAGGSPQLLLVAGATVHVVTAGVQGPAGAPGEGLPMTVSDVAFAFGDASPKTLVTALSNKLVYQVSVVVTVPFNGTGAQVTVGDDADPDRLVQAANVDLSIEGTFEFGPNYKYASDTPLKLFITPGGGASQGAGRIIITAQL